MFKTLETYQPRPKQKTQNGHAEPQKHIKDRPVAILMFFTSIFSAL